MWEVIPGHRIGECGCETGKGRQALKGASSLCWEWSDNPLLLGTLGFSVGQAPQSFPPKGQGAVVFIHQPTAVTERRSASPSGTSDLLSSVTVGSDCQRKLSGKDTNAGNQRSVGQHHRACFIRLILGSYNHVLYFQGLFLVLLVSYLMLLLSSDISKSKFEFFKHLLQFSVIILFNISHWLWMICWFPYSRLLNLLRWLETCQIKYMLLFISMKACIEKDG